MQIGPSPNQSNADRRQNTQLNGSAETKAIVKRNELARSKQFKPITEKKAVDTFKQSPPVEKNNHDETPGKPVESVPSPAEATDTLQTMSDDEDSVFEEGGETPAVARAVKLLKTSPTADFRSAKIQSDIKKLQGAKDFLRETVLVLETMIAGLQADIIRHGTRAQQESFQSDKLHWESVINKHKKNFGERARPFRKGAHKTGRKGSGRLFKDILTTGESITVREEKGITTKRAARDAVLRARRISEERRQLGPIGHPSAEGALVSAAFGRTVSRGSGLSEGVSRGPSQISSVGTARRDPSQRGQSLGAHGSRSPSSVPPEGVLRSMSTQRSGSSEVSLVARNIQRF